MSYRAGLILDLLNTVKQVLIYILALQLLNIGIIITLPRYALGTSFLLSLFFIPLGVIYYIGCLLSIQNVIFSRFDAYSDDDTIKINQESGMKFISQRYRSRMLLWGGLFAIFLFIYPLICSIFLILLVINIVSDYRTKGRFFFAESDDVFLLTPTSFSKTLCIPNRSILDVKNQDRYATIKTTTGNIELNARFVDKNKFDQMITILSLAAINNR